jgi:LPXTG-motif cell wall-anchored protein
MRKVLLGTCGALAWLALSTVPAAAQQSLPSVVISETIRDAPGSVHVVSVTDVDPAFVGGTCDVTVTGENNASVHPNSDILIDSANTVVVPDVERAAGAEGIPADGTLQLGSTLTISVRLGGDGVFSGGFLEASFACTPPAPPPPPVTTLTVVTTPTSPTGATTPVTVAAIGAEQPVSGTLPRTGSDNTGLVVVAVASLGAGAVLLARAARSRRSPTASR